MNDVLGGLPYLFLLIMTFNEKVKCRLSLLLVPPLLLLATVLSLGLVPLLMIPLPTRIHKGMRDLLSLPGLFLSSFVMSMLGSKLELANEGIIGKLPPPPQKRKMLPMERSDFMLSPSLKSYFNTGTLGLTPRSTLNKSVEQWKDTQKEPLTTYYGPMMFSAARCQKLAASYIGADFDDIVFIPSTTRGLAIVVGGLVAEGSLQSDDTVLTTSQEHEGGLSALHYHARSGNFKMRTVHIPIHPVPEENDIVSRFESAIDDGVKAVVMSHVSSITGTRYPISRLSCMLKARGILCIVDGAQAAGGIYVNMKELGVDAYTVSAQKWTLAPPGTGLLYTSSSIRKKMSPVEWSCGGANGEPNLAWSLCSFYTHSTGTTSDALCAGLEASIRYIQDHGYSERKLEAYNLELRNTFYRLMEDNDNITILSPSPESPLCSPIVAIQVKKLPAALHAHLFARGYVVKVISDDQCNSGVKSSLRFSFHGYNTLEDVNGLAECINLYTKS